MGLKPTGAEGFEAMMHTLSLPMKLAPHCLKLICEWNGPLIHIGESRKGCMYGVDDRRALPKAKEHTRLIGK